MESRSDRALQVKGHCKTLDIPIKFYTAIKQEDGLRGCFESHQRVMRKALRGGHKRCLIFEDDFEPAKDFKAERIHEVAAFLDRTDWDIVFLGCFPDVWAGTQTWISGNMFKVSATCMHAYVVSEGFMKKVSAMKFEGVPIDEVVRAEARCYATLPSLFLQTISASDVSSKASLSLMPQKNIVTRSADFYAQHVGLPLKYVVEVFIMLWILCVALKSPRVGNII